MYTCGLPWRSYLSSQHFLSFHVVFYEISILFDQHSIPRSLDRFFMYMRCLNSEDVVLDPHHSDIICCIIESEDWIESLEGSYNHGASLLHYSIFQHCFPSLDHHSHLQPIQSNHEPFISFRCYWCRPCIVKSYGQVACWDYKWKNSKATTVLLISLHSKNIS